ncbi:MAG TPA: hypothetical protein VIL78_19620 [Hanamia sp.]
MDTNSNILNEEQLLDKWQEIGEKNRWIREAYDPAFSRAMLEKCESLTQLHDRLKHIGWCLGQGFYYRNLCFINQRDGGDEWLTIKDDYAFESITFEDIIGHGHFYDFLEKLLQADKIACKTLNY